MEDENEQVPIKFTNSRENLDDFELLQLKTSLTNTWQDKQLLKHWENSLTGLIRSLYKAILYSLSKY